MIDVLKNNAILLKCFWKKNIGIGKYTMNRGVYGIRAVLLVLCMILASCTPGKQDMTKPESLPAVTAQTLAAETDPTVPPMTVSEEELKILAKVVWGEARGIKSRAHQAAIVWCILNRLDSGIWGTTIAEVATKPHQFAYKASAPVEPELYILAQDVCSRWWAEKNGAENVGRTLPKDYLYFYGDGKENRFYNAYPCRGRCWDWSLPDPYEEESA